MSGPPQAIRLKPEDAPRYVQLRRRMLEQDPYAYSADLDDDFASDAAAVATKIASEFDAIFAVQTDAGDGALAAAAGVAREKRAKYAHRAHIWGVFVEPAYRGRGWGKAVLSAAIELARTWPGVAYVDLTVSENSIEAHALYKALGFQAWGQEPETTEHEGRRYDEIYMTLRL